jgi:hypothetical protein
MLASAAFFSVMIFSVRGWKSPKRAISGVPETIISGIESAPPHAALAGDACADPPQPRLQHLCEALWALLPVIARDQLGLGAGGYGMLSACFGIGAITGALLIPRALHRTSLNTMVVASVSLGGGGPAHCVDELYGARARRGVQLRRRVGRLLRQSVGGNAERGARVGARARAVGMNILSSQAGMAAGAALWGSLASASGTRIALAVSAGAMLVLVPINRRVRVEMGDEAMVTPGMPMPELTIAVEPEPDDGPVLIQLEYGSIRPNQDEFLRIIGSIEPARRRNGAVDWRVFRDLGEDARFVERS